jgi:DNA-binding NarL/FixJ family response regulator
MKILIVDDHAIVREGLAQVLQNLSPKLQLFQAKDGAQALATLLPHQDMDLVLRPQLQSVDVNPESPNIPVSLAKGLQHLLIGTLRIDGKLWLWQVLRHRMSRCALVAAAAFGWHSAEIRQPKEANVRRILPHEAPAALRHC